MNYNKSVLKKLIVIIFGFACGLFIGYKIIPYARISKVFPSQILSPLGLQKPHIIGFLPYWLIGKADRGYGNILTDLTYFGLTLNPDGKIQKRTKPTETEPGWLAINSGKMDTLFADVKKQDVNRTLLIFSGNDQTIAGLLTEPEKHAQNLITEIQPIMKQYEFTGLNLDIESVANASMEAQIHFTEFVIKIRKEMNIRKLGTLSIDVSPTALFKPRIADIKAIVPFVDTIIFMMYDYHYQGSPVTGPVAPVNGAELIAEFDIETALKEAIKIIPKEKIIVGIPLYGYEWETLNAVPRSAIIPGTGITASNRRVEEFLSICSTCSAEFDPVGKEAYVIYKDEATGVHHQIFYPDTRAMEEKIKLAKTYGVGGIALWALGYENESLLEPLKNYR